MTQQLGIGVLGCGNTSRAYFEMIPKFQGLDLRACADLNGEVAQVRASEYGVRSLTVHDLLLADDIDLIVNLTAPDAHRMVIQEILQHGKHVYTEKPLVTSLKEGRSMAELADQAELQIGCAPDTCLGSAVQTARKAIDGGVIGQVTGGTCHAMNFGMEILAPDPGMFYKAGGGPVQDFGPYYIAALLTLIGPVQQVAALSAKPQKVRKVSRGPNAGETIDVVARTTTHAVLEFGRDILVSLAASWDVQAHAHRPIEIYGTEGTLLLPDPVYFGGDVVFVAKNGDRKVLDPEGHPFSRVNLKVNGRERANYRSAGLADMVQAMQSDREYRCNIDRGLHMVAVIESIQQASTSGQVVSVDYQTSRPAPLTAEDAASLLR